MADADAPAGADNIDDEGYWGVARTYVSSDGSINWSFIDRIIRGSLYAAFVAVIGIITESVGGVLNTAGAFATQVRLFVMQFNAAGYITQGFVAAQQELSGLPSSFAFVTALLVAFGTVWVLNWLYEVLANG